MCQRHNTGESNNFYFGIFISSGPLIIKVDLKKKINTTLYSVVRVSARQRLFYPFPSQGLLNCPFKTTRLKLREWILRQTGYPNWLLWCRPDTFPDHYHACFNNVHAGLWNSPFRPKSVPLVNVIVNLQMNKAWRSLRLSQPGYSLLTLTLPPTLPPQKWLCLFAAYRQWKLFDLGGTIWDQPHHYMY